MSIEVLDKVRRRRVVTAPNADLTWCHGVPLAGSMDFRPGQRHPLTWRSMCMWVSSPAVCALRWYANARHFGRTKKDRPLPTRCRFIVAAQPWAATDTATAPAAVILGPEPVVSVVTGPIGCQLRT